MWYRLHKAVKIITLNFNLMIRIKHPVINIYYTELLESV